MAVDDRGRFRLDQPVVLGAPATGAAAGARPAAMSACRCASEAAKNRAAAAALGLTPGCVVGAEGLVVGADGLVVGGAVVGLVGGAVVGGPVVGGGPGISQPFARIARPCVVLFSPPKLLGGMLNAGMMSPHFPSAPVSGKIGPV